MITAVHAIVNATDAEAARAFFRDTLNLPFADAGHGWLIFALPPAELAFHPADSPARDGSHQLYLMCDDLNATIAELKSKGVEFTRGITQERWGSLTALRVPGAGELFLYEPKHASPLKSR
jgi:catechol 2,3-dioxygenase-like lactoylglutathione lyase family enzyme